MAICLNPDQGSTIHVGFKCLDLAKKNDLGLTLVILDEMGQITGASNYDNQEFGDGAV
jgi:hypothetical protein